MDKSDLKALLSELLEEVLEEKLEQLTVKHERKEEKKTKYRRRKQQEKDEKQVTKKGFDVESLGLTAAEKKELAQASKSDRANKVHVKKERLTNRRPSGKIEVRCRSCGKTEKVSPLLVYKDEDGFRYKCNKCSCSAG